jgi:hypothetical protein
LSKKTGFSEVSLFKQKIKRFFQIVWGARVGVVLPPVAESGG